MIGYVDDLPKFLEDVKELVFKFIDGNLFIEVINIESIIRRILYLVAGLYANLTLDLPITTLSSSCMS